MAQLRQQHEAFVARETVVLVTGPDTPEEMRNYFKEHDLPFVGLPDPTHTVLKRFGQEVRLFKLGRMPAQVLVDKRGLARFAHYGHSMADIPAPEEILELLGQLS